MVASTWNSARSSVISPPWRSIVSSVPLGNRALVTVLTRCGLPLPAYFLADEKHSHCLTDTVYLPTIVPGRVHLASRLYGRTPVRQP